jgi:glycosyltransferase involved in cell wall biosynthesis
MTVRISVVLCTHNGATFVEEQLASIVDQELMPWQIIISDDASTDGTADIIRAFLTELSVTHPEITQHFIRNVTPLGVVGNFEAALQWASGDLVALSDQDDIWRPSKLRVLSQHFAEKPNLMLVHSNALLVDDSGESLGRTLFSALRISGDVLARERASGGFGELMKRNIVTGATVVFRTRLLDVAGSFPRSWVHDEWLAVIAAAVGGIDYDDNELIKYRQHAANQIGAKVLNLRARLAKLGAHRLERNARLLARTQDLVSHLIGLGSVVPPELLARAEQKLRHEEIRSSLKTNRLGRIGPVTRELFSGRYFSSGLGIQDVLRDVVQPGRESR